MPSFREKLIMTTGRRPSSKSSSQKPRTGNGTLERVNEKQLLPSTTSTSHHQGQGNPKQEKPEVIVHQLATKTSSTPSSPAPGPKCICCGTMKKQGTGCSSTFNCMKKQKVCRKCEGQVCGECLGVTDKKCHVCQTQDDPKSCSREALEILDLPELVAIADQIHLKNSVSDGGGGTLATKGRKELIDAITLRCHYDPTTKIQEEGAPKMPQALVIDLDQMKVVPEVGPETMRLLEAEVIEASGHPRSKGHQLLCLEDLASEERIQSLNLKQLSGILKAEGSPMLDTFPIRPVDDYAREVTRLWLNLQKQKQNRKEQDERTNQNVQELGKEDKTKVFDVHRAPEVCSARETNPAELELPRDLKTQHDELGEGPKNEETMSDPPETPGGFLDSLTPGKLSSTSGEDEGGHDQSMKNLDALGPPQDAIVEEKDLLSPWSLLDDIEVAKWLKPCNNDLNMEAEVYGQQSPFSSSDSTSDVSSSSSSEDEGSYDVTQEPEVGPNAQASVSSSKNELTAEAEVDGQKTENGGHQQQLEVTLRKPEAKVDELEQFKPSKEEIDTIMTKILFAPRWSLTKSPTATQQSSDDEIGPQASLTSTDQTSDTSYNTQEEDRDVHRPPPPPPMPPPPLCPPVIGFLKQKSSSPTESNATKAPGLTSSSSEDSGPSAGRPSSSSLLTLRLEELRENDIRNLTTRNMKSILEQHGVPLLGLPLDRYPQEVLKIWKGIKEHQ